MADKHPIGPRGGTTTRTKSGLYRVVVYLHEDEVKALKNAPTRKTRPGQR